MRRLALAGFGIVLCFIILALSPDAFAQETSPPLFAAPGVESAVLGQADVSALPADARLYLEQIDLPAGSTMEHAGVGGEVIHVVEGTVTLADEFGFASQLAAGDIDRVESGDELLPRGHRFERCRAEAESGAVRGCNCIHRRNIACPGSVASRVAGRQPGGGIDRRRGPGNAGLDRLSGRGCRCRSMDALPGRSDLASGKFDLPPQLHDGPIAILPTGPEGLTITSPSGMQGVVQPGQAVLLPATAPLVASNGGIGQRSLDSGTRRVVRERHCSPKLLHTDSNHRTDRHEDRDSIACANRDLPFRRQHMCRLKHQSRRRLQRQPKYRRRHRFRRLYRAQFFSSANRGRQSERI